MLRALYQALHLWFLLTQCCHILWVSLHNYQKINTIYIIWEKSSWGGKSKTPETAIYLLIWGFTTEQYGVSLLV